MGPLTRTRRTAALVLVPALIAAALAVTSAPAAAETSCRVRNERTGEVRFTLQEGLATARLTVDLADADTLVVTGTCTGTTTFGLTSVHVVGERTATHRHATLDAEGDARNAWIGPAAHVTMRGLRLVGGDARTAETTRLPGSGGSLLVEGDLRLTDVVVVGSSAVAGGGIAVTGLGSRLVIDGASRIRRAGAIDPSDSGLNGGGILAGPGSTLRIGGSTRIDHTVAGYGAGIYATGAIVRIGGRARIDHVTATHDGGALWLAVGLNDNGAVIGGRARIDHATAADGPILFARGMVTIQGRSRISDNAVDGTQPVSGAIALADYGSDSTQLFVWQRSVIIDSTGGTLGAPVWAYDDCGGPTPGALGLGHIKLAPGFAAYGSGAGCP